jgi:hypothetical protein
MALGDASGQGQLLADRRRYLLGYGSRRARRRKRARPPERRFQTKLRATGEVVEVAIVGGIVTVAGTVHSVAS